MTRTIRAPRGATLTCKNWLIEAAYRMIQNNLDPEVAFDPDHLIVYGGRGRAARNWECYRRHPGLAARSGARRDVARPVGQAGRRLQDPRRRPTRADRQLEHRAALGHAGKLRQVGGRGPDHVRPDDRRKLDLHRHAGHPAGHLRDLRRAGPAARLGHAQGQARAHRGPGRDGRRATAGRDDERGRGRGRRRRSLAHRPPAGAPLPGRRHRQPGRGDDVGGRG